MPELLTDILEIAAKWSFGTWVAVAAAVGAVGNAIYTRSQTKSLETQHKESLKDERERHDEQIASANERHEEQIVLLRQEVEESKRQWEASGAVIQIEGRYRDHPEQRPLDRLHITVRNRGRMPAYITRINASSISHVRGEDIDLGEEPPVVLDPGSAHQWDIERSDVWLGEYSEWGDLVVTVHTGDGGEVSWNRREGMDFDFRGWP